MAENLFELFTLDREQKLGIRIWGCSYIERRFIRDMSGFGRAERGLVNRKNGDRLGKAGFEHVCMGDTARIQRGYSGS